MVDGQRDEGGHAGVLVADHDHRAANLPRITTSCVGGSIEDLGEHSHSLRADGPEIGQPPVSHSPRERSDRRVVTCQPQWHFALQGRSSLGSGQTMVRAAVAGAAAPGSVLQRANDGDRVLDGVDPLSPVRGVDHQDRAVSRKQLEAADGAGHNRGGTRRCQDPRRDLHARRPRRGPRREAERVRADVLGGQVPECDQIVSDLLGENGNLDRGARRVRIAANLDAETQRMAVVVHGGLQSRHDTCLLAQAYYRQPAITSVHLAT